MEVIPPATKVSACSFRDGFLKFVQQMLHISTLTFIYKASPLKVPSTGIDKHQVRRSCAPGEVNVGPKDTQNIPLNNFQLGATRNYHMALSKTDHLSGLGSPHLKEALQGPTITCYCSLGCKEQISIPHTLLCPTDL